MSRKFWKSQSFKTLQVEWELRLKESGFTDIEDEKERLKQNAANSYRTRIQAVIEGKRRYYELLGQGVSKERTFKDFVEGLVMKRRSKGVKIKEICDELEEMGERCHRNTIGLIIRYYESRWKIKNRA